MPDVSLYIFHQFILFDKELNLFCMLVCESSRQFVITDCAESESVINEEVFTFNTFSQTDH